MHARSLRPPVKTRSFGMTPFWTGFLGKSFVQHYKGLRIT
jgi:hypothetical protein